MEFNYALEKRKFEEEWAEKEKEYTAAGMCPYAIAQMREYDLGLFKARRIEALHTQELDAFTSPEDEDAPYAEPSIPKELLNRMITEYDTYGSHSRYWWMEELENPCLAYGVSVLSPEDKELLTLVIIERCTTREIADRLGLPKSTIAYQLQSMFSKFRENP